MQNKEEERARVDKELANIRGKFRADRALSSYEKKKYVTKMLYIYMLGYDMDFGHMEAVGLISATKFSEKQVGYMVTSVLLNEHAEFLRLIINSVRNDIISNAEHNQCLGLSLVANIGGKEFAEALALDVQRLVISSSVLPIVRKKACLTLLRLYRRNRDIVQMDGFVPQIIQQIDERDLGVLTALMSLVQALVADPESDLEEYAPCVPKLTRVLERLVTGQDVSQDYTYYGIPSPWLQMKVMRVLQYFPPTEDDSQNRRLHQVLRRVLMGGETSSRNGNKNNALHGVLFEAIQLVVNLGLDAELMSLCVDLLGKFLKGSEPNVRYLGLESMSRLSLVPEMLEHIKMHQEEIINALSDPDISIRRRALDVLYGMCDETNSRTIAGELLSYLTTADFAIREELALKLAILAEKFAPDLQWYCDVTLELVEKAGEFVSDDIWFRIVQIITNHDDLQEYAAVKVLDSLKAGIVHESMVKVSAYVLGEFSHLIAAQPGCSPQEVFELLNAHFASASAATKNLLLSAYVKMLIRQPDAPADHTQNVMTVFKRYASFADQELQQRAVEYEALLANRTLGTEVLAEMPKFPERESSLLKTIEAREGDSQEVSVMRRRQAAAEAAGELEESAAPEPVEPEQTEGDILGVGLDAAQATAPAPAGPAATGGDPLEELMGLSGGGAAAVSNGGAGANAASDPFAAGGAMGGLSGDGKVQPIGDVADWYRRLMLSDSGVLYEDPYIQVGVKMSFQRNLARLQVFLGNKHTNALTQAKLSVAEVAGVASRMQPVPETLQPRQQEQTTIDVALQAPYVEPPKVCIKYTCSDVGAVSTEVTLPVPVTKFMTPMPILSPGDFFTPWKEMQAAPNKVAQMVSGVPPIDLDAVKTIFSGLRLGIAEGLDPNPNNLVAASGVALAGQESVLVLARLEVDPASRTQFRITVCSRSPAAAEATKVAILAHMQPAGSGADSPFGL